MSAAIHCAPPPRRQPFSLRPTDTERTSLYGDQSGAIMVIGVFIAIVLVGLLFYVAGVGNIAFRQERMQDAADAVALATAIGHARGMNLIVFINLVMAALVAILLALKMIELLLTGLELILLAISWFVPPAAGAVPIVEKARGFVHDVHDTAKDIVDNILIGLNAAERAIAYITPFQAVTTSAAKVTEKYGGLITLAVGVPTRATLPVENDKYDTLCEEGGKILKGLIDWATDPIPFIGKVLSMAGGALLEGVKHAFCYQDQKAPSAPIDITRMLPMDATGVQCEDEKSKLQPSEACQKWEKELLDRHPEANGDCVDPETDKDRAALCRSTLVAARQKCQPGVEKNISSYSWSEQEVEEHVKFDTTSWTWVTTKYGYVDPPAPVMHNATNYSDALTSSQTVSGDFGESQLSNANKDKGIPCDDGYLRYSETQQPELLWSPWNVQPTSEEFPGVTSPVCDKRLMAVKQGLPNGGEIPPETPDHKLPYGFNPDGYTLKYPSVKQVYGCTQEATIDMTFPTDWESNTGSQKGDDKAPQKMEEGVDKLGTEVFQIRGVVVGGTADVKTERGLFHGAFDRNVPPESWVPVARAAGKIAVAQAEYYFNHNGIDKKTPYDWMWSMDWRARLVRFRLPSGDEQQDDGDQGEMSVAGLSSSASDKLNLDLGSVPIPGDSPSLDSLEEMIVH